LWRELFCRRIGTLSSASRITKDSVAHSSVMVASGATHCAASLSRCCIFAVEELELTAGAFKSVAVEERLARETVSAKIATNIAIPRRLSRGRSASCSYPTSGIVMQPVCLNECKLYNTRKKLTERGKSAEAIRWV